MSYGGSILSLCVFVVILCSMLWQYHWTSFIVPYHCSVLYFLRFQSVFHVLVVSLHT